VYTIWEQAFSQSAVEGTGIFVRELRTFREFLVNEMERVVITGMGAITPLGLSAEESWQNALAGRSGVGPITLFDAPNGLVAAEARAFDGDALLGHKSARRMDRFEQMANVAANEAIEQSGLTLDASSHQRIGLSISCAFGGLQSMIDAITAINEKGPERVSPLGLPKFMTTSPTISIAHDLRGPSFSVASACATGADGIGIAYQMIRAGVVDGMVAGGADAPITSLGLAAFDRMYAYSHRQTGTPSPFSAERDGIIAGEGAGVLVLESLSHARARGASILAEVAGYGATTDAYHVVAPREDGAESARAIRLALDDAGMDPDRVDTINAHGTGTTLNDAAETAAIKLAFGEQAYHVPISSTKSMTGHMMGASGAVEAIFCILAIRDDAIPPTINYQTADPTCDLDYVPNQGRKVAVKVAMSNAFGFGGHNAVLVFQGMEATSNGEGR